MITWLDVAYATLNIFMMFYSFRNYYSSKRKSFLLFGSGFTFLLVSDFVWVLAISPGLSIIMNLYSYIRLGLYTIFALFILRALQLLDKSNTEQPN